MFFWRLLFFQNAKTHSMLPQVTNLTHYHQSIILNNNVKFCQPSTLKAYYCTLFVPYLFIIYIIFSVRSLPLYPFQSNVLFYNIIHESVYV